MKKLSKEYYFELAVFCAHYHSGQWSRGYRLLSKLRAQWSSAAEREAEQSEAYQWLVANYADKV
jgi:hypothetical protein